MRLFLVLAFIFGVCYSYASNRYQALVSTPAHPGEIKAKSEMTKQEISTLWIATATPEAKLK